MLFFLPKVYFCYHFWQLSHFPNSKRKTTLVRWFNKTTHVKSKLLKDHFFGQKEQPNQVEWLERPWFLVVFLELDPTNNIVFNLF